ncbi:MAG: hypothetical protein R2787_14360 [Saprospiraceae bacterium]
MKHILAKYIKTNAKESLSEYFFLDNIFTAYRIGESPGFPSASLSAKSINSLIVFTSFVEISFLVKNLFVKAFKSLTQSWSNAFGSSKISVFLGLILK